MKAAYLRKDPYVSYEDRYYVFYGEKEYAQAHSTVEVTVSEAHGYGMLIAALMSTVTARQRTFSTACTAIIWRIRAISRRI